MATSVKAAPHRTLDQANVNQTSTDIPEVRYVRPGDVALITGLSRSKVMAAIWSGELVAFQRDRAWLIPINEIDRWIRGESGDVGTAA